MKAMVVNAHGGAEVMEFMPDFPIQRSATVMY